MRVMSLTFSLRRLLVGVTVVCVLCALVANFPQAAHAVVLGIPFVAPTIVMCAVLPWCSSRPLLTLFAAIAGAWIGWMYFPHTIHELRSEPPDWWDMYSYTLQSQAFPAAAGAFFGGFACVGFFPRWVPPIAPPAPR